MNVIAGAAACHLASWFETGDRKAGAPEERLDHLLARLAGFPAAVVAEALAAATFRTVERVWLVVPEGFGGEATR